MALAFAPSASGAITIGSDLSSAGSPASCPFGDCTVAQTSLPGRQVASPIDGVVVLWRVRNATSPAPVRFRILRPAPGGAFTGVGSAETPGFSCPSICTVNVRLPIRAGDLIGVDAPRGASAGVRTTAKAVVGSWSPFLAEGETRTPTASASDLELLLNADVEADADGDGYGDDTQDLCPSSAATQQACGKATIASVSRSVAINLATGRGKGKARCNNVAGDFCAIRLALRLRVTGDASSSARTVKLGTAKGRIAGGKSGRLRFKLSRKGVARLRSAERLRVRAVGSSRNRIGTPTKVNKRITLRVR
jgi:hypothetical protein